MANDPRPLSRISFIVGSLDRGGAEKQFIYLLRALLKHEVRVQVLLLSSSSAFEKDLAQPGVESTNITGRNVIFRLQKIARLTKQFQPDYIQATHFYCNLYAGIVGRAHRIPSIGAIRGNFYHDLQGTGRWGSLVAKLPTLLIANSVNGRKNAIQHGIPPNSVYVLKNVIDLEEFDQRASEKPVMQFRTGTYKLVTVARLIKLKRLDIFLQALKSAMNSVDEIEAFIAGAGPEEIYLRNFSKVLGLEQDGNNASVHFLGSQKNIPALLKEMNLFALTSEREGFPNVILEAMAASLPVISTPAGETRDIIKDGVNGFIVPFNEPKVLASKIVELCKDQPLALKLGQAGRKTVESEYSYQGLEKNILNYYDEINWMVRSQQSKQKRQNSEKLKRV